MGKLNQANKYIKEHHVKLEELPVFHVAPPIGWMNDPNGFSYYRGKIHLFYQFHPYSNVWGPMHWGHVETTDFIKWRECPVALAPEQSYDYAGCFSGSGIETEQGHLLVYTGVIEEEIDGEKRMIQNQCIAFGDGSVYKKLENNPVISGEMMPEGFSREDFRDPKIWKEEDGYYLVAGNKTKDRVPQIVLFYSKDAVNWEYVSVLAKDTDGCLGSMWECPDFFKLDEEYMLFTSPQDIAATDELHNGNNSVYYVGEYNKEEHVFHYKYVCSIDDGLDFYAPQTMETPDGRRILIGWMQSWDSNIRPANQKWACMMTVPRELEFVQGKLIQRPVREIANYHKNSVSYEHECIRGECKLQGISGRIIDMTVEVLEGDFNEFSVSIARNEQYHTEFTVNKKKRIIEIDRTYSGMVRDTIAIKKVKLKSTANQLKLRFILDRYSFEVFLNDGEQVFSTTLYTPQEAEEIRFFCDGVATVNIDKHDIVVD